MHRPAGRCHHGVASTGRWKRVLRQLGYVLLRREDRRGSTAQHARIRLRRFLRAIAQARDRKLSSTTEDASARVTRVTTATSSTRRPGFMRGRLKDGELRLAASSPYEWGDALTARATPGTTTWSVFHDVQGLVDLDGRPARRSPPMLDSVFAVPTDLRPGSYYGGTHPRDHRDAGWPTWGNVRPRQPACRSI